MVINKMYDYCYAYYQSTMAIASSSLSKFITYFKVNQIEIDSQCPYVEILINSAQSFIPTKNTHN